MGEKGNAGKSKSKTLCWYCQNAVPVVENDEYVMGCSWSKFFIPVDGWVARETTITSTDMRGWSIKNRSYIVYECPEFIPDPPRKEQFDD